jgi:DNA-binding NarL/FixJ family response regulator
VGSDLIGVALIEDHPLYRQGLMHTVEANPRFELVAAAGSIGEMEAHGYVGVHVVLLDLHLPDGTGADAVSRVSAPGRAVLVVSASDDSVSVVDAIGAGASGYLHKSCTAEEIAIAVTAVASGGMYVSPVLAAYLLRDNKDRPSEESLTPRENEILALLAEGETDADIAKQLFLSIHTVHSHLDRIRDKTGQRRRADLTRYALQRKEDHHS